MAKAMQSKAIMMPAMNTRYPDIRVAARAGSTARSLTT